MCVRAYMHVMLQRAARGMGSRPHPLPMSLHTPVPRTACRFPHLFQELLADEFTPLDAEFHLAAGIAQVCSVQHQLQQHISVPPACQIRLLGTALAECIQQPHVLRHVCRQDCIHNQPASLQGSAKTGCLRYTW